MNTSTLTISPVTEQDEDEYYCVASNGGADGLLYSDKSHNAIVTVYGELHITIHNGIIKQVDILISKSQALQILYI